MLALKNRFPLYDTSELVTEMRLEKVLGRPGGDGGGDDAVCECKAMTIDEIDAIIRSVSK